MSNFTKLCRLAGEAVCRYSMIDDGDRIMVGLSGGKDSMMMLHVLEALRRRAPVKFSLLAATFDPGFEGFGAETVGEYCRSQDIPHRTVRLDIPKLLAEKDYLGTPCVLCSRLRRGKLYGLARQCHCNKLALGQHLDDLIVSFLMSLCRGQGLATMAPKVRSVAAEEITVVRPLATAPESLIIAAAAEFQLPRAGICRYEERLDAGDRAYFKELVNTLGARIPDLRSAVLRSLANPKLDHLL